MHLKLEQTVIEHDSFLEKSITNCCVLWVGQKPVYLFLVELLELDPHAFPPSIRVRMNHEGPERLKLTHSTKEICRVILV